MRGIELFFTSPLVGLREEFGSTTLARLNRSDTEVAKKGEREKDRLVLLVMGRDDRLLLAYLKRSAVSSDIDTSTWRNRASLRVRTIPLEKRLQPVPKPSSPMLD